jgi:integration host factor subunit beta
MTKADLIEEVSRLAELTRKDSEVIVDTIFDSVVRSLRVGDKIEIRGLAASARASASRASAGTRKPATAWKFRPRKFPSSSPARN